MKTRIKLLFAGLALAFCVKAQVPNGSFEQWQSINLGLFSINYATGWENNNPYFQFRGKQAPVTKTTDSHSGQYAISLKNVPDTGTFKMGGSINSIVGNPMDDEVQYKFPIASKPVNLLGYYKYASTLTDTFTVNVSLYKAGEYIGGGDLVSSNSTNDWRIFKVELEYYQNETPDSASVNIFLGGYSNNVEGTELILDDLTFEDESTGIDQQEGLRSSLLVFPNPVISSSVIEFEQLTNSNTTIDVIDILGNKVDVVINNQMITAGKQHIAWSPSQLRPGIYFIRVTQAETSATIRVNHY